MRSLIAGATEAIQGTAGGARFGAVFCEPRSSDSALAGTSGTRTRRAGSTRHGLVSIDSGADGARHTRQAFGIEVGLADGFVW